MVEIQGVSKTFQKNVKNDSTELKALANVNLSIRENEFVSIIGPSGCGKTTLLKIIDGLISCDSGTIAINGKRVTTPGPDRAVVFQTFALLPWRTVLANVEFSLELRQLPKEECTNTARNYLKRVGLADFENHYPHELSGGMQQRVNLARALASDPAVLLMDEPFAALDAQTREHMQAELLKIWSQARKTVVFITHQINEAVYLADRVVVMSARPGGIKGIFQVPFERPRTLSLKRDQRFLQIEDAIWQLVEEQPQPLSAGGAD